VTLAGGFVVIFGHEVLGPSRHANFAHLPTLPRKASGPAPVAVPTALPEPLPRG
jgi:hypothetical protein